MLRLESWLLRRQEGKAERKAREEKEKRAEQEARDEKKPRVEKEKLDAAEKAHREARKLSAPTPAERLEDARRKLNDLKAAEGAKVIEIAGADSTVPLPPDVTIDLYLSNGVSSIEISGSSVSVKSGSGSSSNDSRTSSKTKIEEDLEEEKKKEMSEKIQAIMEGNSSSKSSISRQKLSTTNSTKLSTSTQKQLSASSAKSSTSIARKKIKEESEPESKKTGMLQKLRLAMMGRK